MAQLVEHNLAKVGVAGSSPVVRSIAFPDRLGGPFSAKWPSGKAEACKAFTPGSNPGFASRQHPGAPAPVLFYICGHGSVGRAQPCQGWGRGFEPRCPLQTQQPDYYGSRAFSYPSLGLEPERERAFLGCGWGVVCRECLPWAYHRGHLAKSRCKGDAPHGYRKNFFALMDVRCRDLSDLPALV